MAETRPLLTREHILAQKKLKLEIVDVPEWGGPVRVQELTGRERDEFDKSCVRRKGKRDVETDLANIRAKLVAWSVRDEQGKRIFGDGDVGSLGELSASSLERVAKVAMRLSAMTDEDLEELSGNSGGEPSDRSASGSPSASASPTSTVSSSD